MADKDVHLGAVGKVAFGAACAACCAVPVLVVGGAVTVGALAVGGSAAAAVVAVVVLAALVGTRRVRSSAAPARFAPLALGGAGSLIGLWGIRSGQSGAASIVAVAIATLTASCLLTLAERISRAELAQPDLWADVNDHREPAAPLLFAVVVGGGVRDVAVQQPLTWFARPPDDVVPFARPDVDRVLLELSAGRHGIAVGPPGVVQRSGGRRGGILR